MISVVAMYNLKLILLCLTLCIGILSASTQTNETASQLASGLCSFKILVVEILPTIALISFLVAPFALGLAIVLFLSGLYLHTKRNPDIQVNLGNFNKLDILLRIGLFSWALAILFPLVGVICVILAIIAPILMNIFVSMATGTSVVSSC